MQSAEHDMMPAAGRPPVRAVIVGLGAIGSLAATECLQRDDFEIVGAVDPQRAGESIGAVQIQPSLESISGDAEVALLCTASTLAAVQRDLETLTGMGMDVASTCEELTLPWFTDPEIAGQIDARAREAGRTILGCGVNPGLVMDVLPLLIAGASLRQRSVTVHRAVNLDTRRPQLRQKLGVGRPLSEWQEIQTREGNRFGHFGLVESACLLALGLGWTVESTDFSRRPLVAGDTVNGVEEVVRLAVPGGRRIELRLVFEAGGIDVDEVTVDGEPSIRLVAEGGVHGDRATVARLLAAARVVGGMPAGLRLPIEAPLWVREPTRETS